MTQNSSGLLSFRLSVMSFAMLSMAALTCCSLIRQSASAMTWFISTTVSVITVGPVVKTGDYTEPGDLKGGAEPDTGICNYGYWHKTRVYCVHSGIGQPGCGGYHGDCLKLCAGRMLRIFVNFYLIAILSDNIMRPVDR